MLHSCWNERRKSIRTIAWKRFILLLTAMDGLDARWPCGVVSARVQPRQDLAKRFDEKPSDAVSASPERLSEHLGRQCLMQRNFRQTFPWCGNSMLVTVDDKIEGQ